MASLSSRFQFDKLKTYNGPGVFLGGGFAAGFLIFLIWLAMLPPSDKHAAVVPPVAGAGAPSDPLSADAGVLNGISGSANVGQRASMTTTPDDGSAAAQDQAAVQDGDAAVTDENGDAPVVPDEARDEQAIANGLLDSSSPSAVATAPPIQTFYVEIRTDNGDTQTLEINAESAEHARSIVRDFHGNPRILRGPSPDPLR